MGKGGRGPCCDKGKSRVTREWIGKRPEVFLEKVASQMDSENQWEPANRVRVRLVSEGTASRGLEEESRSTLWGCTSWRGAGVPGLEGRGDGEGVAGARPWRDIRAGSGHGRKLAEVRRVEGWASCACSADGLEGRRLVRRRGWWPGARTMCRDGDGVLWGPPRAISQMNDRIW